MFEMKEYYHLIRPDLNFDSGHMSDLIKKSLNEVSLAMPLSSGRFIEDQFIELLTGIPF
jgi:hypothetical protein